VVCYLQINNTKTRNIYLLLLSILIVVSVVFGILPRLNIKLINHNIEKGIDANVYLYTEIEIKKEWSQK